MGWEKRGKAKYYYKPVRVEGKSRKIYVGSGPAGRIHEILDRQATRKRQPLREAQARIRNLMREGDRLWGETWSWLWPLAEAQMLLAGYYRHRGQWRKVHHKARTRHTRYPSAALEPATDSRTWLRQLNRAANGGDPEALSALGVFLNECPDVLTQIETLNRAALALWADHQYRPDETDRPETTTLEQVLKDAVYVAELNRRHADSLLESGATTALGFAARHARIEKADNRLRRTQQLLIRMRATLLAGGDDRSVTSVGGPAT